MADKIYRNRKNREFYVKKGIRHSVPPFVAQQGKNAKQLKQLAKHDVSNRNAVEGKYGEVNRSYGKGLISTCLQ
ncbi:transposase [Bacillaceae bacterium S4-13-56]